MLKRSKYNHFIKCNDMIIAYNARTNALAEMNLKDYEAFLESVDNLQDELQNDLKHGGFLINQNVNELDIIRHNIFISRFSSKQLGLTIAPTSNCNFRCPYCYEKDVLRASSMSDKIAEDIVNFVENNANDLSVLSVTWYGGEPLLELGRIEKLSKSFLDICKKYNVKYDASMVTNGYLLSKDYMKRLMNLKVRSIQITLDGAKDFHDQTRYLIGKKPTFDHIIENLKSLKEFVNDDQFPGISIRMNINRKNYAGCKKLISYLHENEIDKYCEFYPAIVTDVEDKEYKNVYTSDEFEQIKKDVQDYKNEIGFCFPQQNTYPEIKGNWCVCDMYNSFVIDSDGLIYKCWELMGNKENSIGHISDFPCTIENSEYYENVLEDPTLSQKCSECDILPICNGGSCPVYRKKLGFKPNCEAYRKTVNEQILSTYKILKDNMR